jgi:hypothetical protein
LEFSLGCIGSGLFGSSLSLRLLNTIPRNLKIPVHLFDERSSPDMQNHDALVTAPNVLKDIPDERRLRTVPLDHFTHLNLAPPPARG